MITNIKVGRAICLLLILWLVTIKVNAVMEENLDKLQISDDAITERAGDDKLISKEAVLETNQQSDQPLGIDSVTIIWYLTTFTALLGFLVVMACTENSCRRRKDLKPPEMRPCPPTPCPSYKHFAPPSYDSVMKKYNNQRVFIISVYENNNLFSIKSNDNSGQFQVPSSVKIEKANEMLV